MISAMATDVSSRTAIYERRIYASMIFALFFHTNNLPFGHGFVAEFVTIFAKLIIIEVMLSFSSSFF